MIYPVFLAVLPGS